MYRFTLIENFKRIFGILELKKMEEDLSEIAAEVRASSSLVEAKKENLFFEELAPEGML